jgi:hypothetical protein
MMKIENVAAIQAIVGQVFGLFYAQFREEVVKVVNATVDARVAHAMTTLGTVKVFDEALMHQVEEKIEEKLYDHTEAYEHKDNYQLNKLVSRLVDEVDMDNKIESYLDNKLDFDDKIRAALRDFDFDDTIRAFINNNVRIEVD